MKLLVIGATRGIGEELVKQALAAGHQVRVMARTPEKVALEHKNLEVVAGDVLDPGAVVSALEGQEAVVLSIGLKMAWSEVSLFSEGTRILINAMEKAAIKRLLVVTGLGAGDSLNHGGFLYDKVFYPLMLKHMYRDKDRQEMLIRNSGLDWVIVRPGMLTNGDKTGSYRAITDLTGVQGGKISRADVAHFLLTQAESDQYLKQMPVLIY